MGNTILIAQNETVESGSFMGDQACSLKTAYLFVENTPDLDHVIMSVSPGNQMHFLWEKFIDKYNVELVYDNFNPGDWPARWTAWDKWRAERKIEGRQFDKYFELYLRIHGSQRQRLLCGSERGLGHCIYEYWWRGQEDAPEDLPRDVEEWDNHGIPTRYSFGDDLIYHPPHTPTRDVYISPRAKTQGNRVFTLQFWADVVHQLIDAGVSVTVGHDGQFCEDLNNHPLYRKHWGDHRQWVEQVCQHKLCVCGNTGTGWLAAACGVPLLTMEPPGSQMPDHRYRECGLRNIVEVVDTPDADHVARRITEEVNKCLVMTTGCYDVLHSGHVRHLEKCRSMGTRLIVALNSDQSVRKLKGESRPINPDTQRKAVLEGLRSVDEVRIVDEPTDLISEIRPDVLAVGCGYTPDTIVGRDLVESYGGRAVVTYQGDAKDEPSTTKIVKRLRSADVVDICRIGGNASVNPFEKLKLMADHFLTVKDLPGDVADLGTCRGGTAYILHRLADDKHLHMFDNWGKGNPYDDQLCHHKKGEWAASLEECKRLVGTNDRTWYFQGIFPESADHSPEHKFCFVYVDMDVYKSIHDALEFFWPRLVPGGKIVVDDYRWLPCSGTEKAVDEMFPPEESERYKTLPGMPKRTVIPSLYTIILEK